MPSTLPNGGRSPIQMCHACISTCPPDHGFKSSDSHGGDSCNANLRLPPGRMNASQRMASTKPTWFHEDGVLYKDVISRADEANAATEQLKKLVSTEVKSEKTETKIFDTKKGLEDQINSRRRLAEVADTALGAAIASNVGWNQRRSHGLSKIGASIQNFATNLAKVLDGYSGIVNVLQSAGGPYGSAGYSALSCLLTIAVNKSKSDDRITKQLEYIHNFFPRINLLAEIYEPDKKIAELVVEVHYNIVFFARDAALYFVKKSRRFMASVTPASMAVDVRVEKIKDSLIEISEWTGVFLHRNTDQLLKKQDHLQSSIGNLEKSYRAIQDKVTEAEKVLKNLSEIESEKERRMEQDNLEKLCRSLGYPNQRPHCNLKKWSSDLERAFRHEPGSPKARANYSKMTLQSLENETYFEEWRNNLSPKLLLFGGKTILESRSYKCGYSWLSTAAADIANSFRAEGQKVVFFTCHPDTWDTKTATIHEVIASALFQIAESDPRLLNDKLFRNSSHSLLEDWKAQEDVSNMVDFASKTMVIASATHCVYMILDRLDVCGSSPMNNLQCLKDIVASPLCKVKILTTWDTIDNSIKEAGEDFSKFSKNLVTAKMELHQSKGHGPPSFRKYVSM